MGQLVWVHFEIAQKTKETKEVLTTQALVLLNLRVCPPSFCAVSKLTAYPRNNSIVPVLSGVCGSQSSSITTVAKLRSKTRTIPWPIPREPAECRAIWEQRYKTLNCHGAAPACTPRKLLNTARSASVIASVISNRWQDSKQTPRSRPMACPDFIYGAYGEFRNSYD